MLLFLFVTKDTQIRWVNSSSATVGARRQWDDIYNSGILQTEKGTMHLPEEMQDSEHAKSQRLYHQRVPSKEALKT